MIVISFAINTNTNCTSKSWTYPWADVRRAAHSHLIVVKLATGRLIMHDHIHYFSIFFATPFLFIKCSPLQRRHPVLSFYSGGFRCTTSVCRCHGAANVRKQIWFKWRHPSTSRAELSGSRALDAVNPGNWSRMDDHSHFTSTSAEPYIANASGFLELSHLSNLCFRIRLQFKETRETNAPITQCMKLPVLQGFVCLSPKWRSGSFA